MRDVIRVVLVDPGEDSRKALQRVLGSLGSLWIAEVFPNYQAAGSRIAEIAPDLCLVILDSDHSCSHVLKELQSYHRFVTPNSYLIVEDTNVNGHPVFASHGPGPMEAVEVFLLRHQGFVVDHARERFLMTLNPSSFLLRTG